MTFALRAEEHHGTYTGLGFWEGIRKNDVCFLLVGSKSSDGLVTLQTHGRWATSWLRFHEDEHGSLIGTHIHSQSAMDTDFFAVRARAVADDDRTKLGRALEHFKLYEDSSPGGSRFAIHGTLEVRKRVQCPGAAISTNAQQVEYIPWELCRNTNGRLAYRLSKELNGSCQEVWETDSDFVEFFAPLTDARVAAYFAEPLCRDESVLQVSGMPTRRDFERHVALLSNLA